MESKKHLLAQKKLGSAVKTFTSASDEIEKAIELIDSSIAEDNRLKAVYEDQIAKLQSGIVGIDTTVQHKQAERESYVGLQSKLKEFSGVI